MDKMKESATISQKAADKHKHEDTLGVAEVKPAVEKEVVEVKAPVVESNSTDELVKQLVGMPAGVSPFGKPNEENAHTHSPEYPHVRLVLKVVDGVTSVYCPISKKEFTPDQVKALKTYRPGLGV